MKSVFPIIITPDPDGGYVVSVPSLDIGTQGETIAESIEMARDAIGLWGICEEDAGRTIPDVPLTVPEHAENEIISLVDVDFVAYRRANEMKTVRKNVTLPSWLNYAAEQNGINFSQVLQSALKAQLQIE